MPNYGDESVVKESARKSKLLRDQEVSDIFNILATKSGRRFIWRYLRMSGLFEEQFTGNSTTFFNLGKHKIGLSLFEDIKAARPEAYMQMEQESKQEETENE